jgi:hypothetical protein
MVGLERFELNQPANLKDSGSSSNENQKSEATSGGSAPKFTACPDLARIVKAWGKLPTALRAAILAIVASAESEATKGGQP